MSLEIRVVAGVYTKNDDHDMLVGLRSEETAYPDAYECPGGKVNEGESDHDALRREWWEELGAVVGDIEAEPLCEFVGVDDNGTPFRVVAYRILAFGGTIVPCRHIHSEITYMPVRAFVDGRLPTTPAMPSIIDALLKPSREKVKHAKELIEEMERWKRKIEADNMRSEREVQFYNRIGNDAIYSNLPLILEGLRLVIDMETPDE